MRYALSALSCGLFFTLALHAQEEEGKRKFPPPESLSTDSLISPAGPGFTVPDSDVSRSPRIIVYGDQRFTDPTNTKVTNPQVRRLLVGKIAEEHPDAVLMNGDVPYSGDVINDYQVFYDETKAWRDEKLHIYPSLGNHEFHGDPQEALDHWWSAFPYLRNRRWYSVQLGKSIYTIALDSSTSLLAGSNQRKWLSNQLMNLPASVRFVFISLHHPPVADFQTHINVSHNPRPNEIELRDYLESVAPTMKAKIVLSAGHIHNYERFSRNGVTYLVSGGGAASPVRVERKPEDLYQNDEFPNYHFVEFTLKGDILTGKMYRLADPAAEKVTWEVKDTFEIKAK